MMIFKVQKMNMTKNGNFKNYREILIFENKTEMMISHITMTFRDNFGQMLMNKLILINRKRKIDIILKKVYDYKLIIFNFTNSVF